MILKLNINSATKSNLDSLLIKVNNVFENIKKINTINFNFDNNENHIVYIRYSLINNETLESKNFEYSNWEIYDNNILYIFDNVSLVSFNFKIVRNSNTNIITKLENIEFDIEFNDTNKTNKKDIKLTCSCEVIENSECGIIFNNCGKENLFNPYLNLHSMLNLYESLNCSISDMFGHCVRYFKVSPYKESSDKILHEYSLYDITSIKDIKIVVPDNVFPSEEIEYTMMDMGFQNDFEIHIMKEDFEKAFGQNEMPQQRDFIYIPLNNRIYEIHSTFLHRDFMQHGVYYKVKLYKWQNKQNVYRDEITEDFINDLTSDFSMFEDEIEQEFIDVTKPESYTTININSKDSVRTLINNKLNIVEYPIKNFYTTISKYYYDMSNNMNRNEIGIEYKLKVKNSTNKNQTITFWFNFLDDDMNTVLYGMYNNEGIKVEVSTNILKFYINDEIYTFYNLNLIKNKWYGFVINITNIYKQLNLFVWEILFDEKNPTNNRTTELKLVYNKLNAINNFDIELDINWQLHSGNYYITNIRFWKHNIEEEEQPLILNQYIVKDSSKLKLLDNCIPPLRMVKDNMR